MPDDNTDQSLLPSQLSQQLDPNVVDLITQGASSAPKSQLQGQVAAARDAQTQSALPPAIQNVIGAMSDGFASQGNDISNLSTGIPSGKQQTAIQQGRQQAAGDSMVAADRLKPKPIIYDLINAITGKNIGGGKANEVPGYNPPSKLDHFNNFLTSFITSLGQGFSQAGHGPGSFGRGFGGAVTAPYEQDVRRYSLEQDARQKDALIDLEKKKVDAMTPSIDIVGPKGESLKISPSQLPQYLNAGYRFKGQEVAAQAKRDVANTQAQNKLEVEALKSHITQGTASRFIPDVDKDGNRFYHVYNKFGKEIGQADVNVIPSLMSKTSSTTEIKQQEDGSFITIPKMTTTGPVIPVKGGSNGATGVLNTGTPKGNKLWATNTQTGGGRQVATPILDASGNPVFGKAPENIRTMAYTAKATLPHMDEILNQIDELDKMGVLGEFKGKGTDFLTKKGFTVPGLNQEQTQLLGRFVNNVKLMDSAMLRTHFGARGGQQMYEKFSEMLNAGEHPDLMRGGLQSFKDYLTGYGNMMTTQTDAARKNIPSAVAPQKTNGHLQGNPFVNSSGQNK